MILCLLIAHAVAIGDVSRQLDMIGEAFRGGTRESDQDDNRRWFAAVAAPPVGIDPADRFRQSMRAAVEIERARLSVVAREDGGVRLFLCG